MAKAAVKIDFSALQLKTADADKRSITSDAVARPVRDIIAQVNESVRQAAWQACLTTVAEMYGKPVEAKGANWDVNDDEAARAIRVNYNLIQPDFFPSRKVKKMDKEGSQMVWKQIFQMLNGPDAEPTFSDTSDEQDDS